jgi:hypothetical protein
MSDDYWNGFGIDVVRLLAGFSGGVVAALTLGKAEPWSILIRVIVGGLTANYLGRPAEDYIAAHITDIGRGGSFLVGICGMVLCQAAISFAKIRSERYTKQGDRKETQ